LHIGESRTLNHIEYALCIRLKKVMFE
jgi:hypothetical protein